jgi:hypothetical protein
METAATPPANHGQTSLFQKLGFILASVALLFANLEAAVANDDFPSSVTGTWMGEHCGNRSVTWGIQMSPSNAYVREITCAEGTCEEADYRVSQVGSSDRKFAVAPYYIPKAPRSQYAFSVVLQYSADGQQLDGLYVAHPSCQTIRLRKKSVDVLPPLSTRSAARLPRPVLTVSAEPPPIRPSSSGRADDWDSGRRSDAVTCGPVCQPTGDGQTYCVQVCD